MSNNAASEHETTAVHWDDFLPSGVDTDRTALAIRSGGLWRETSYRQLRRMVELVSSHLIDNGLAHGERVAILSESRPEWVVAFFAALRSGATAVPLDVKLTVAELAGQLQNAEPRVLFVSSDLRSTAGELASRAPSIQQVILLNGEGEAGDLQSITSLWGTPPKPARLRNLDETAMITYTSGTTGNPKGVMTTFHNLLFQIETCAPLLRLGPRDITLSVLPLNHLFELTGELTVLYRGGRVCYANTLYPEEVAASLRERQVTRMVVVPLFLKLLMRDIERQVERSGWLGQAAFRAAFAAAGWVQARALRRVLFGRLHRQLGGTLSDFVCGGAPLDPAVESFFHRLGFSVYPGYGLTETSPVVSANAPGQNRLGSVGCPLPGVEVRIAKEGTAAAEGEILTRGPHVMRGYYRRNDLTLAAIDREGWLHTGDVGRLDADGFLYVTGRIKDLIVLGGGKKVLPDEVEGHLLGSSLFKEASVVGRTATDGIAQGTEEVWAVIVLNDVLAARRCESPAAVEEEVRREVERLVQDLAPYKRPRRVVLSLDELPKTSTRKVQRFLVQQWLEQHNEVAS